MLANPLGEQPVISTPSPQLQSCHKIGLSLAMQAQLQDAAAHSAQAEQELKALRSAVNDKEKHLSVLKVGSPPSGASDIAVPANSTWLRGQPPSTLQQL